MPEKARQDGPTVQVGGKPTIKMMAYNAALTGDEGVRVEGTVMQQEEK